MEDKAIENAARILAEAEDIVAFTGAGISAESNIPTFRDPGGIWDRFDPREVGTTEGIIQFALKNPSRIKGFLLEVISTFENAHPNKGHIGLVDLEKMGLLRSVITQNIDDLHAIAGNSRVFEVHGNLYRLRCINCGKTEKHTREELLGKLKEALNSEGFDIGKLVAVFPRCKCGGFMRPDVVMFGEAVQHLMESYNEARSCDVMLIMGTSGMVWPAAGVPYEARKWNTTIIEINPTTNAFRDITEVYVKSLCGEAMPLIVEKVRELR